MVQMPVATDMASRATKASDQLDYYDPCWARSYNFTIDTPTKQRPPQKAIDKVAAVPAAAADAESARTEPRAARCG